MKPKVRILFEATHDVSPAKPGDVVTLKCLPSGQWEVSVRGAKLTGKVGSVEFGAAIDIKLRSE